MAAAIDGVEIVPGLWIGSNKTCDALRQTMGFRCINVGHKSHTLDQRCTLLPVCGEEVYVDYNAQAKIYGLIVGQWPQYGDVLLHCADALTYSPLSAAMALQVRYQVPFAEAYQWVKQAQPALKDMSQLVYPVAKNTAWAGA